MIAAGACASRSADARVLTLDASGTIDCRRRGDFPSLLREGDLVIANDAATLPASLGGRHAPTRRPIEVRLAARRSLSEIREFSAVVFGEGDFRQRTEDRPPPPRLAEEDRLELGPLRASIQRVLDHPRLISLRLEGSRAEIAEGLAQHGRPIQYAHVTKELVLWDVWTAIAGPPVAFEPPSAGFALDWALIAGMAARSVGFATITHAAGISSTGDAELDRRLPFDEPYRIPESTARMIAEARRRGGRLIAVGTTVVRALEHAAARFGGDIRAGEALATQRIGEGSVLRALDAVVSGVHAPGTSHHELLRAFIGDDRLAEVDAELSAREFRTHEFGEFVFLERAAVRRAATPAGAAAA
jgi:S-adenosylmethionine:tRNA ribosyltransferase-isomerase